MASTSQQPLKIKVKYEQFRSDVFPHTVHDALDNRHILPTQDHLRRLCNTLAFVIYLEKDTIYYCRKEFNNVLKKHFCDTLAYLWRPPFHEGRSWLSAQQLLKRPIFNRKSTDQRTCFRYGESVFLTKKCFTFGQRSVEENTQHIIQVGSQPFSVYFLEEGRRGKRLFLANEEHKYRQRILSEYTVYSIPSKMTYVLFTPDRALFSLHIVKEGAALPFPNIIKLM